jgi:phospholipase A1
MTPNSRTTFPKPLAILTAALASAAGAQAADCRDMADNAERLACYDRAAGRPAGGPAAAVTATASTAAATPPAAGNVVDSASGDRRDAAWLRESRLGATLGQRWELDAEDSLGSFLPRPYKPMYLLPLTVANAVNAAPSSPSAGHTATPVAADGVQRAELKFQISLKAKVWEGLFTPDLNLWIAYTQSSRWQVYNAAMSRPFRETNYEPELIAALRTDYSLLGWHGRLAALSLTHQSNGRALPLSRSWNRVIGEVALEREQWSLVLRPWWRIKESIETDDNPGIENYIGRGELLLTHRFGAQTMTLQARHSLRGGESSHGSLQLDWAFPIGGNLKGYVQGFTGYGESMIDYNFRQNKLGVGISLVEWL